jgi:hypothetical protein
MKKHLVWSNNDPNDSFEVQGNTFEEVLINALSELGWSVSEKPIEEEEFPEGECTMEAHSKREPNLVYLVKGRMTDSDFVLGDYKVLVFSNGEVNESNNFYRNGYFAKDQYTFKLSKETF